MKFGRNFIFGSMVMNQDFKEFIELLNTNKVQYLVVGGYAVAYHGYPRYTKDLDLWINPSISNAEKILIALKEFGFGSLEIAVKDLVTPEQTIQLGYPPIRIDLITSIDGVIFEECYPNRIFIEDSGITINVIDLDKLKKNKRASGRAQDLADLENL
jgi:hypothetical protein